MSDKEEEQSERPRPKVVDKRVSARPDSGAAAAGVVGPTAPDTSASSGAPAAGAAGPTAPETVPSETRSETSSPGESSSQPRAPTDPAASSPSGPPGEAPISPEGEGGVWTPEREEQAREMARQVAETPSLEWVVNVAVTLANVAGTKLDLGAVGDARLAIDALAALVEKLGSDLQETEAPLRTTLSQLQLAYAERAGTATPPSPS